MERKISMSSCDKSPLDPERISQWGRHRRRQRQESLSPVERRHYLHHHYLKTQLMVHQTNGHHRNRGRWEERFISNGRFIGTEESLILKLVTNLIAIDR